MVTNQHVSRETLHMSVIMGKRLYSFVVLEIIDLCFMKSDKWLGSYNLDS